MTDDESEDFSPDSLFHKFTIHILLDWREGEEGFVLPLPHIFNHRRN